MKNRYNIKEKITDCLSYLVLIKKTIDHALPLFTSVSRRVLVESSFTRMFTLRTRTRFENEA